MWGSRTRTIYIFAGIKNIPAVYVIYITVAVVINIITGYLIVIGKVIKVFMGQFKLSVDDGNYNGVSISRYVSVINGPRFGCLYISTGYSHHPNYILTGVQHIPLLSKISIVRNKRTLLYVPVIELRKLNMFVALQYQQKIFR